MQFTGMPYWPSSWAICRVKPIWPAFALAYAWMPVRLTLRPAPEEMLTIRPPPAAFMPPTTARVHRNVAARRADAALLAVFTLFAEPFQALGGIAIWLWLPVGAGVVLISLVYGHLAARLPVTGYAYQWASRIISPHYGWFTGWNAMLCTLVGSAGISVS